MKNIEVWKTVDIGDVVECYFDHHKYEPDKATRLYRILDITVRYGTGATSLIKAVPADGKTDWFFENHGNDSFSAHFITKVIKRAKGPGLLPRYHPHYMRDIKQRQKSAHQIATDRRGVLYGPLDHVLICTLNSVQNLSINTQVNIPRAKALYAKTHPGLIEVDSPFTQHDERTADQMKNDFHGFIRDRGWVRIKKKALVNWLKQNINKIQYSKKELDVLEDRFQKEMEEDYYRDLEADWDREHRLYEQDREHQTEDDLVDPPSVGGDPMYDEHDIHDPAYIEELIDRAEYEAGHAFLDEQERLRKMNEEAYPPHDPQPIQTYQRDYVAEMDEIDLSRASLSTGPQTIGQLIARENAREFIEKTKDVSYDEEQANEAQAHLNMLRRVFKASIEDGLAEDDPVSVMMATLGSKLEEHDRIYLGDKVKDGHL